MKSTARNGSEGAHPDLGGGSGVPEVAVRAKGTGNTE